MKILYIVLGVLAIAAYFSGLLYHFYLKIIQKLTEMKEVILQLQLDVANEKTVNQSAITLLTNLNGQLKNVIESGDLDALKALSAELEGQTNDLAAAVSTNTPAATA